MVDIGAILASILAKGFGIELKFIDKSTGKSKVKTKTTVNDGLAIQTKGKHNTVNIFLNSGSISKQSQPVVNALSAAFSQNQVNYLMKPAKQKLSTYRTYEARINNNRTITTFTGILPDRHIALIKTGLYIRMLSDDNNQSEVQQVTSSLVNYTREERYIINLANALHFTHYLLPTFNQLKDLNDGLKRFKKHYYDIINGVELALFVHRTMTEKEIYDNVVLMAKRNLKYGVVRHKIYVHATGVSNVDVLNHVYRDIKKMFPLAIKKRLARDMPNLTIKIPYQVNNLPSDTHSD